jgi:4-amino-4-deoxy-L-arabinose transferase-like glycosyltransferase
LQVTKYQKLFLIVFLAIIFNSCFGLASFPEYFWDEGVYVDRATNFVKTLQMYQDPNYIDHPPLGWIIPSILFAVTGFPESIVHLQTHDMNLQLLLLFLIPRLVAVSYILPIAILVYKLSDRLYNNKKFALISLATFGLIPAFWPFRNLLLDPLMILFVLVSLFLIMPRNDNLSSKSKLIISGLFFGCALLVKFSAIFFLPAMIFYVLRNNTRYRIIWSIPLIATFLSWIIVMSSQHDLSHILSTQLWQANRVSSLPYGIALQILAFIIPIGLVFGITGIVQSAKKKQFFASLLSVPYLGFLFRGGFVGFVHTIPILPILSIFSGKPLYDFANRVSRIKSTHGNDRTFDLLLIVLVLSSIGITIWITSFDAGQAQREAIEYLTSTLPKNSTLVTNPGYGWVVKQFRPDLQVTDFFSFNFIKKIPDEVYFAESTSPDKRDSSLIQTQSIYEKSCLVKTFKKDPPLVHPYSFPSDMPWDVMIHHYITKGCQ